MDLKEIIQFANNTYDRKTCIVCYDQNENLIKRDSGYKCKTCFGKSSFKHDKKICELFDDLVIEDFREYKLSENNSIISIKNKEIEDNFVDLIFDHLKKYKDENISYIDNDEKCAKFIYDLITKVSFKSFNFNEIKKHSQTQTVIDIINKLLQQKEIFNKYKFDIIYIMSHRDFNKDDCVIIKYKMICSINKL
jgi:hypothetical protein